MYPPPSCLHSLIDKCAKTQQSVETVEIAHFLLPLQLTHKISSNLTQPSSFHFITSRPHLSPRQLLSVLSEHTCLSSVAWSHRSSLGNSLTFAGHPDSLACFGKFSARYCLQRSIAFHSFPSRPICCAARATKKHKSPELPV